MLATTSGETLNIISNIECEIEIEDFFKQLRSDISIFKNSPVIDEEKLVSKSISRSLFKYDNYSKNVSAIKDIIFRASIDCEKYVGGSSDTFLLILEKILSLHKGKRLKYIQDCLLDSMELIKYKKRLSQSDISKMIKNYQPESKKIINDFIRILSPRTILSLEKSDFFEDRIIQKQNLHFDVRPIPGFCSGEWVKEEVSILMVDGIIEEVSQIHHFLTQAFDTKEPFLLISRAYKPEVLKTIAENNMRGNTVNGIR